MRTGLNSAGFRYPAVVSSLLCRRPPRVIKHRSVLVTVSRGDLMRLHGANSRQQIIRKMIDA